MNGPTPSVAVMPGPNTFVLLRKAITIANKEYVRLRHFAHKLIKCIINCVFATDVTDWIIIFKQPGD